jgi:hypothetical protein
VGAELGKWATRGFQGFECFPSAFWELGGVFIGIVFSVRVMGSASEATAARGLSGVVVSLIVLAVGSFLVVRFRTS